MSQKNIKPWRERLHPTELEVVDRSEETRAEFAMKSEIKDLRAHVGRDHSSDINIYRHRFNVQCPNNDAWIIYELEIASPKMLMVEKIVLACSMWKSEYHEKVADGLMYQFPGTRQILRAHHHGVDIETHRSAPE